MKGVAMSALNASWDRVQKKARRAWYRVHGLEEEWASLVEELKAQEQDPSIDQKKTTEMLRQLMKVTHTLQSEKEISALRMNLLSGFESKRAVNKFISQSVLIRNA